jgi:YD repeat-containing protein
MPEHLRLGSILICLLLAAGVAIAATATYDYDALGRLTRVQYADGKVAIYRYDAAGNRTQVLSGTLPAVPASITVPSSSATGAYTVSWGAASGTVTAYKLYQASNASFSGQTLVYSGTALSVALSGRSNGTYYYRVQACFDADCSAYRTGANGVVVVIGP